MGEIRLTYVEQDKEQARKIFDVLMVWFEMDIAQVLDRMNNNPIAVEYSEQWIKDIKDKVEKVGDKIKAEKPDKVKPDKTK